MRSVRPHRPLPSAVLSTLGACAGTLFLVACSPGAIRHERETTEVGLAKPSMVYVYEFAVQASEVQLDQGGPLARVRNSLLETGNQDDQEIALGRQVAQRVAQGLAAKLTAMGLPAQRAVRGAKAPAGSAIITGQFADVD